MTITHEKRSLCDGDIFFIQVEKRESFYAASVFDKNERPVSSIKEVNLDPASRIDGKSIKQLLKTLEDAPEDQFQKILGIKRQILFGQYLYDGIFAPWLDRRNGHDFRCHVQIISSDPHIRKIPWSLLSDSGVLLTESHWTITLSQTFPKQQVKLGRFVKFLLIAPEPAGLSKTDAEGHERKLLALLKEIAPDQTSTAYFRKATTWKEIQGELKNKPDVVYFYGHGGSFHGAHYIVLTDQNLAPMRKTVVELRRAFVSFPSVLYLNGCSLESGSLLGTGNQFDPDVAVVIANRRTVSVPAASATALAFFKQLLSDGTDPVKAILSATRELPSSHWCASAWFTNYSSWQKTPSAQRKAATPIHGALELDRNEQCARLVFEAMRMITRQNVRLKVFIWFGSPGEGVSGFQHRFRHEIRNLLPQIALHQKNVDWWKNESADVAELQQSCAEIFNQAFEVQSLDEIRHEIGVQFPHIPGKTRILYVHHPSVDLVHNVRITPERLRQYLVWSLTTLSTKLPDDVFSLIGISFIVPSTRIHSFYERLTKMVSSLDTEASRVIVLPKLPIVTKTDVLEYLRIRIPHVREEHMKMIAEQVTQNSLGQFDRIIQILSRVEDNWMQFLTSASSANPSAGNESW